MDIMDIKDVYIESAAILEEANNELSSVTATEQQREFLSLKFMSALIHNDLCPVYYNMTVNPTTETSRLLTLGSVIMKLFEAHIWYSQSGTRRLRKLAENRNMKAFIEDKCKEMKQLNPSRIEKYSKIRNDLSVHYSVKTIDVIRKLGSLSYDDVFEDIKMMVAYGLEWKKALRSIGKLEVPEKLN